MSSKFIAAASGSLLLAAVIAAGLGSAHAQDRERAAGARPAAPARSQNVQRSRPEGTAPRVQRSQRVERPQRERTQRAEPRQRPKTTTRHFTIVVTRSCSGERRRARSQQVARMAESLFVVKQLARSIEKE